MVSHNGFFTGASKQVVLSRRATHSRSPIGHTVLNFLNAAHRPRLRFVSVRIPSVLCLWLQCDNPACLRDETALITGGHPLTSLTSWRDTLEAFLLITPPTFYSI